MPHSFNRLWIHAIWSTKDRTPMLNQKAEKKIYEEMKNQFTESGCPVRIINGMPDHAHSLFLLNPKKALTDVLKQVKGGTSHWINQQDVIREKFAWQTGYAAYSVSESVLEKVYQYILNQKEHHKKTTYLKEIDDFNRLHKIETA